MRVCHAFLCLGECQRRAPQLRNALIPSAKCCVKLRLSLLQSFSRLFDYRVSCLHQRIGEKDNASIKNALIRKPLHPRSCSTAIRLFIVHLVIDNPMPWRIALVERSPSIARVSRARFYSEQAVSFFGKHSLVMRERPAIAFSLTIKRSQRIHDVVPPDNAARSGNAKFRRGLRRARIGSP